MVEPDAAEDEAEELALGVGVCLGGPEDREVFEHLACLVEAGERLGCERGQLRVDRVAAGDVLGAGEVAELVEVARAVQALLQGVAAHDGVVRLGCVGGEAVQDLLADGGVGCEAGEEARKLALDLLGWDDRLVAGVVGAAGGAVVAGRVPPAACGALHAPVAAAAAREPAQEVVGRRPPGFQRAGALAAELLHAVEQRLFDDRLVQASDRLAGVAVAGDVAGVGGVAEHLADGVHAERAPAGGALLVHIQPRS
ncbi:MAG TPA: hypothetical protein VGL68_06445 [Solirubrobacteraceae bacterium]